MFNVTSISIIFLVVCSTAQMRYKNQIVTTDAEHLNHLQNTFSTVQRIALKNPNDKTQDNNPPKQKPKGMKRRFVIDDSSPTKTKNGSSLLGKNKDRDINTLFDNYNKAVNSQDSTHTHHFIEDIRNIKLKPIEEKSNKIDVSFNPINSNLNLSPGKNPSNQDFLRQSIMRNMIMGQMTPMNHLMMNLSNPHLSGQHLENMRDSITKNNFNFKVQPIEADVLFNDNEGLGQLNEMDRMDEMDEMDKMDIMDSTNQFDQVSGIDDLIKEGIQKKVENIVPEINDSPVKKQSTTSLEGITETNSFDKKQIDSPVLNRTSEVIKEVKKVIRRRKYVVLQRLNCGICLNDIYLKLGLVLLPDKYSKK